MATSNHFQLAMALGSVPSISSLHWANGQGLISGFNFLPSWCIIGVYLCHWSNFLVYHCELLYILGHQYPYVPESGLQYGYHKFLHAVPPRAPLQPRGVWIASIGQYGSVYIVCLLLIVNSLEPYAWSFLPWSNRPEAVLSWYMQWLGLTSLGSDRYLLHIPCPYVECWDGKGIL